MLGGFSSCVAASVLFAMSVVVVEASPHFDNRSTQTAEKRAITPQDGIEMNVILDPTRGSFHPCEECALFSNDRKYALLLLKHGDLQRNRTIFSLVLFRMADLFDEHEPEVLFTMSSSSNRDAISSVRWLPDDDTIVFLGETETNGTQIWKYHLGTRQLERVTSHATSVDFYEVTADGQEYLFAAEAAPAARQPSVEQLRRGIVIEGQHLEDLLGGRFGLADPYDVFIERGRGPAVQVSLEENYSFCDWCSPMTISPDGRWASFAAQVRTVPEEWRQYTSPLLWRYFEQPVPKKQMIDVSPWVRLLYDVKKKTTVPAVLAPDGGAADWSQDGTALFVRTYLPIGEGSDAAEREKRKRTVFPVKIDLPTHAVTPVQDSEWPKIEAPAATREPRIVVEQSVNDPPKLYAVDSRSGKKQLLLDPNPQFRGLKFGRVETLEWTFSGYPVIVGLYLPADYVEGKRYPLVIQTHGFDPKTFSMDGLLEYNSAYAARPLAAHGFIVLQAEGLKNEEDASHIYNDRKLGDADFQSFRNFLVASFEQAIDRLDERGVRIDRDRIGISGFSATVATVEYMLTHSSCRFAAAVLVDGVDAGFFQQIAMPSIAWNADRLNGGYAPFGRGLNVWIKESPSFSLDRIGTPVRLVDLGTSKILHQWELYSGLSQQGKPVDFVLLPDAAHRIVKPWERLASQQGLVDWYRFWLKGEEDSDPEKSEQYARWRALRRLSSDHQDTSGAGLGPSTGHRP